MQLIFAPALTSKGCGGGGGGRWGAVEKITRFPLPPPHPPGGVGTMGILISDIRI